ncbi:MAG: ABC transporter ATP-binding protein [Candidatus Aminicenantes bacterium]|nr:ABC transporter ATP-binding protein [Candidatus Aminicenantes bacterium]
MIAVENLVKRYGDLVAVNDLSFSVEEGRIWGLLGPNAAGKTTTMRILTGFLPASEGTAAVAGFDVFRDADKVKQIIGYLPEVPPLYPDQTVTEYLGFVADLKKVPSAKKKDAVARAVKATGLESVKGRLIKNISRGYRQRVGIAQALVHDPKVLILDEPTIGLDPAQIREIRSMIQSLKGERTIILSTHILAEVTQTCDGVVIVNEGRLKASGSLSDLTASVEHKDGVVLKVRGSAADAAAALRALPGVDKADLEADGLRVEWAPGADLRDDVARLVVEKGFGLLEMRPITMNIEDLYLKIVSGGVDQ